MCAASIGRIFQVCGHCQRRTRTRWTNPKRCAMPTGSGDGVAPNRAGHARNQLFPVPCVDCELHPPTCPHRRVRRRQAKPQVSNISTASTWRTSQKSVCPHPMTATARPNRLATPHCVFATSTDVLRLPCKCWSRRGGGEDGLSSSLVTWQVSRSSTACILFGILFDRRRARCPISNLTSPPYHSNYLP